MTKLLVRVANASEAAMAAAAGIDAIEMRFAGAPTADLAAARAVRLAFPGQLRLRFDEPGVTPEVATAAEATQAEEIALPLPSSAARIPLVDALLPPLTQPVAVIDAGPGMLETVQDVRDRVDAVLLEPVGATRLIDRVGIAQIDAFAQACRSCGLSFGFSGGLEPPDVARLLLLEPELIAFDTAVRQAHAVDGALDKEALDALRALIPRHGMHRGTAAAIHKVVDRIFVRDFEVALAIGAYQAEHGSRQRVRFSIVADVAREPVPPRDMRDVFSYDVIIETIRVLAERAHVTFVETLAEEVAASLLTHGEVVAVKVKVEKLDVIAGAVGIEILRRRTGA